MIYTEKTKAALKLCFEAHKNQTDKSGMPYVFHPFHLAEQMGFSSNVLEALKLLTHNDDIPYMEYVAKIKNNPIAKAVKLADLEHNSDLSRLDTIDEKVLKRKKKYSQAIRLLNE